MLTAGDRDYVHMDDEEEFYETAIRELVTA